MLAAAVLILPLRQQLGLLQFQFFEKKTNGKPYVNVVLVH